MDIICGSVVGTYPTCERRAMFVVPTSVPIYTVMATRLLRPLSCISGIAADDASPLVALCAETSWPLEITVNGFLLFDSCVMTLAILTIMLLVDEILE